MKKRLLIEPETAEAISKMRERLVILEKKIDILIGQSLPRFPEVKPAPKPFPRQENNYRERLMHKAICADCKSECEVPFRPSGERPVYCKECFSKRKSGGSIKARLDYRPRAAVPAQEAQINKPEAVEKKKPAAKKKPVSKKKKK
jgi:CxxC-x17-CxxC domain-containing protein